MHEGAFTGTIYPMTESTFTTYPPATQPPTGNAKARLLIAATHCYERRGIAKTTMEDIAQQANLTRRTVYRHYPSHKEILRAVVVEQSLQFLTQMHRDLAAITDFGDYFVEALIYTIKRGSSAPTHAFLFDFTDLPLVHEMFLASEALLEQGAQLWQVVYNSRGNGDLDMNMLTEWYNRITVSYLTIPSPHYQDDKLRELLAALVKPVLKH